ncbi:unnamed protein product [Pleuronectes platessa]|uniref:Uncharacterized protein n=1 Tax=Pleuronectes platessa TaxID=8262 RepID=A0A9N7Z1G4_PLEPL|nr:unnamed protein product [Pleuronectes platessa]
MGRLRKRHNWKGRLQNESQPAAEKDKADEVVVELQDGGRLKGVDKSNALVLPSNKAKKKKSSVTQVSKRKPLTKRQKKELVKVLERKEKKAHRADILIKLAEVQIPESEIKLLYTTAKMGTGDKIYQTKNSLDEIKEGDSGPMVSSVIGANRKRKWNIVEEDDEEEQKAERAATWTLPLMMTKWKEQMKM